MDTKPDPGSLEICENKVKGSVFFLVLYFGAFLMRFFIWSGNARKFCLLQYQFDTHNVLGWFCGRLIHLYIYTAQICTSRLDGISKQELVLGPGPEAYAYVTRRRSHSLGFHKILFKFIYQS